MSLIPPLEISRFQSENLLHNQIQLHHQMLYRQHGVTSHRDHHHHRHHHHHHQQHHHRHHPEEIANSGWLLPPTPGSGPNLPGDVTVSLQNAKLWQQFHAETTEMIITKLGRRMFPSLQLQIEGLERRSRYCILLEIAPASRRRHKYVGSSSSAIGQQEDGGSIANSRGWTSAGPSEPQPHVNRRVYLHPDSPATGSHWMQHPVSFNKLKLTNNAVDHHTNVVLTSMHKYVPRIWIVRCDDVARLTSLFSQPSSSFCFPETEFIAVTAYQNENITKLKIDNNPFAKGFRETGQSRCKRKMQATFDKSNGESAHDEEGEVVAYCPEDRLEDEDESNVSSSGESEMQNRFTRSFRQAEDDHARHRHRHHRHHHHQRVKRAASESGSLDDSGVSSTGSASPPLLISTTKKDENVTVAQPPRLHRPWADDDENDVNSVGEKSSDQILEITKPVIKTPDDHQMRNISTIELARIQQIQQIQHIQQIQQIQQIQHYRQMQYQQYFQINQIKNQLAINFPFSQQNHNRHTNNNDDNASVLRNDRANDHFLTVHPIRGKFNYDFYLPSVGNNLSSPVNSPSSSAISS